MSTQSFRRMIALPVLILAMVAIPALLLSFTSGGSALAQAGSTVPTTSPLATPTRFPNVTATPYIPNHPIHGCYYFVQPGDTLSTIAVRAKTTTLILMQLNGIVNPNHVWIGQRLTLPNCNASAPAPITTAPTATATPMPNGMSIRGYTLQKAIGNRLSPVIYGYTDNGWLFRSPDNGTSWMLITTRPSVQDFVMSPAEPNVLYSGMGQACSVAENEIAPMYKSVNGGMTFVELANGRNLHPLLAHGVDKNILFASDCASPYLTTDGGFTWVERLGGAESPLANYHAVEMVASQFVGDPKPEQPNWDHLYAAGVDSDGNGIIVYSTDSGNTWSSITPKSEASMLNIASVDADMFASGVLWAADSQGVWAKAGIDASWSITFAGLQDLLVDTEAGPVLKLNDVVAHANGDLYLATVRGLYTLSAGSSEWVKIASDSFGDVEIYNILVTDSNPNVLWLNTASGVFTYTVGQ